jgi:hypothetical protein
MNMGETQIMGTVLAAVTSLMGAYLLTLKIRDFLSEKPDPKLTYATKIEVDKLRGSIDGALRDFSGARLEISARNEEALSTIHELIRRNAEHIAVLIAQAEMFDRRISETAQRVDRLGERIGR